MGKKVGMVLLKCAALALLALTLPSCATTADALLNDQNAKAGEFIEQNSVQPEIKQAGTDVKLNAKTLAKNTVGEAPADAPPYSPANSKNARDGSDKSHEGGVWKWVTGALAVLLPIAVFFARMHPLGAVVAAIAEPYVRKLVGIKQEADAQPDDSLHIDDIQTHITDLVNDPKTGSVALSLLKKIHLEQLVHSPEAPDIHPDAPNAPATFVAPDPAPGPAAPAAAAPSA